MDLFLFGLQIRLEATLVSEQFNSGSYSYQQLLLDYCYYY